MPTTLEEKTEKNAAVEIASGAAAPEPKRDAKWYTDQDASLYPEAVAHILTPRRQRTKVSRETFAAIRAACDKH